MTVFLFPPCGGIAPLAASPLPISHIPTEYRRSSPDSGQDTQAVFESRLNMGGEEVAALRRRGLV